MRARQKAVRPQSRYLSWMAVSLRRNPRSSFKPSTAQPALRPRLAGLALGLEGLPVARLNRAASGPLVVEEVCILIHLAGVV